MGEKEKQFVHYEERQGWRLEGDKEHPDVSSPR